MSEQTTALSIIEATSIQEVSNIINKITSFQNIVHQNLRQGQDYGIIPGTNKPTLLKPGAEKINMLMGITSEFDIVDSTRDFENGFFQYQVKCKLFKNGFKITEGLGACNTKERKYIKQDVYTMDNTVLKMAKKRAFVDATLLVGSLSDIFTQDLEDIDLEGTSTKESTQKVYTDNSGTISEKQAKRMFGLAKGNIQLVKETLMKYKYINSTDVKKIDYDKICEEIQNGDIPKVDDSPQPSEEPKNVIVGEIVEEKLPWDV